MELASPLPFDQLANNQHAPTPGRTSDPDTARAAAEEFEGFFLAMFLDAMFSGIKTDGVFGGGHAEGVYRSLLNQQYGDAIAKAGGLGIADHVQRELLIAQEASS